MKQLISTLLFILISITCFAADWEESGLYSVPYENGHYIVIKIIKLDSVGVHLHQFSNVFSNKPRQINEKTLKTVNQDELPGFISGTTHVAISYKSFSNWGAEFIQRSKLTKNELNAFDNWYESKGGFY